MHVANGVDCINVDLGIVTQSFENAFQQMNHFHRPILISRERVRWVQMLKDREIVSLLD